MSILMLDFISILYNLFIY